LIDVRRCEIYGSGRVDGWVLKARIYPTQHEQSGMQRGEWGLRPVYPQLERAGWMQLTERRRMQLRSEPVATNC